MSQRPASRIELRGRSLLALMLLAGVGVLLLSVVARSVLITRVDNDVDRELNRAAEDFRVAVESADLDKPGAPPLTQVLDGFVNSREMRSDVSYFGMIDGKPRILRGGPAAGVERLGDVAGWSGLTESRNGVMQTRSGTARWLAVPVTGGGKPLGTLVVVTFVSGRYAAVDDAARTGVLIVGIVLGGGALAAWASTRRSPRRSRPETPAYDPLAELARLFGGPVAGAIDDPFDHGDTAMHHSDVTSGRPKRDAAALRRVPRAPGLELTPIDLGQLTDDILAEATARASRQFVVERRARLEIVADRDLLTEAVLHLIDHAAAATSAGDSIYVGTSSRADVVQLWVRHAGDGLTAKEKAELLDADDGGTRTGVRRSLAIARAHNGTMAVANRAGQGTTYTIVLPFDPAHAPTKPIRAGLNKRVPADAREETLIDLRDPDADERSIELSNMAVLSTRPSGEVAGAVPARRR